MLTKRRVLKLFLKDARVFQTSTVSPSSDQRSDRENDGWREKRNLVLAGSVALCAVGAATFYKELRSFHAKLGMPSGIHEVDRRKTPYVYVEQEDPPKIRKRKKRKVWFPWLQSRSHDPWTLLHLAQSDQRMVRLLGTKALAEEHHWNDADYQMLAQACDSRTLVGLARTSSADPRFFLSMPRLQQPAEDVTEDQLRTLLCKLPTDGIDRCTKFFTSSALAHGKTPSEERDAVWSFDGQGLLLVQQEEAVPSDVRLERTFLYALFQHSKLATHCHEIIKLGGLELLQRIYESRRHSIKVKRSIARILANLATSQPLQDNIVRAGWVTVLSRWIHSSDLALSLHATKALANLDSDFGETRKYEDGVYLYHPRFRYSEPVYADIVFVHGLLGGPFRTWRQADPPAVKNKSQANGKSKSAAANQDMKDATHDNNQKATGGKNGQSAVRRGDDIVTPGKTDVSNPQEVPLSAAEYSQCWPKDWLAEDCPNIRIVTVEYETHLSEWAPKCPYEGEKRSLASRSSDMLRKLRRAGIGDRPIIWVGHSMGGLLVKAMLTQAMDNPNLECLVQQTRGMVFYSVPHQGSPLAAMTNQTKYLLYPSVEVKELAPGCDMLVNLHEKFKSIMFEAGIPLLSFGEGCKLDLPFNVKTLVVPPESSDPGFGEYHFMPDLNHLNICKPENQESPLYHLTLEFIQTCLPMHLIEHLLRANKVEEFVLPQLS